MPEPSLSLATHFRLCVCAQSTLGRRWDRRRLELHRRCHALIHRRLGLDHLALERLALRRFDLPQRVQSDFKRVEAPILGVEKTELDTGLVRLLDERKGVPASGAPDGSVADLANLVELDGKGRHGKFFSGVFRFSSSLKFLKRQKRRHRPATRRGHGMLICEPSIGLSDTSQCVVTVRGGRKGGGEKGPQGSGTKA
eukprot:1908576-Prymnesium_polylepis.2